MQLETFFTGGTLIAQESIKTFDNLFIGPVTNDWLNMYM